MLITMHCGLSLPPSHALTHQAGHPLFPDARGTAPISLTPRGTLRVRFGVSVTLLTPQRLSSAVQSPRAVFGMNKASSCHRSGEVMVSPCPQWGHNAAGSWGKLGSWEKAAGLLTAGLHVAVLWVLAAQGVEKQTVGMQSSTENQLCKQSATAKPATAGSGSGCSSVTSPGLV